MRKSIKKALIPCFIGEYNKAFDRKYKPTSVSREHFYQLLKTYEHSSICYWSYCCKGMFHNCWIDEYTAGSWGASKQNVEKMIMDVFENYLDEFEKEGRIAYCETKNEAYILFVLRDLKKYKQDIFITFWNADKEEIKMEIQKERQKGKILMAAQIIKSENESITGIPHVTREDIAKWMNEEKSFVNELISICARLDKREVIKDVLRDRNLSDNERFHLCGSLLSSWEEFIQYEIDDSKKESLKVKIQQCISADETVALTYEEYVSLLSEVAKALVKEIADIRDEDLYTLDVLLEIAQLDISEDDFWWIYVKEIQDGKYILEKEDSNE